MPPSARRVVEIFNYSSRPLMMEKLAQAISFGALY